jgi:hypothetical protein
LGGVQNIEKKEELPHIEKRERSGGSKSETPIEGKGMTIEKQKGQSKAFAWPTNRGRTGSRRDKRVLEN